MSKMENIFYVNPEGGASLKLKELTEECEGFVSLKRCEQDCPNYHSIYLDYNKKKLLKICKDYRDNMNQFNKLKEKDLE